MLFVFLHLIGLAGPSAAVSSTRALPMPASAVRSTRALPMPAPIAPPPKPDEVDREMGDRLHMFVEGELARRMAVVRTQPVPDLGRRILDISELHLDDEKVYDWLPDFNETKVAYTRRIVGAPYYWEDMYHTNYAYREPSEEDAIKKMHSLMREKLYRSRDLIDELMPDFDKYKESLKLRFSFVFRRLDNLLDEMAAIYSFMYHNYWWWHVMKQVFYHQHILRRHIDVVYIVERAISMYMWYKERERRLNSVLAERMQTEANYADA